jgi:hypothetical protein
LLAIFRKKSGVCGICFPSVQAMPASHSALLTSIHQNFTARCHVGIASHFFRAPLKAHRVPNVIGSQAMRAAFAVLFCVVSSSALASPHCPAEPAAKWLAPDVMKDQVVAMGHHIDVFQTTKGNCYEVYGRDSAEKNIEIYFNPVTGEVVEDVK